MTDVLLLLGFAVLTAFASLVPASVCQRALGYLIDAFGAPETSPPADVMRAFHRGEVIVVRTAANQSSRRSSWVG